MAILQIVRTVVFGVSTLFALIIMGCAGGALGTSSTYRVDTYACEGLAVATAVFTLLSLPALLVVDRLRDGAFTSKLVVELSWVGFLCVLWLSTGAATASFVSTTYFANGCGDSTGYWLTLCGQVLAFEAFSWLNWILLLGYIVTILTFSINAASKGEPVWNTSVKDLTWAGNAIGAGPEFEKGASVPPVAATNQYGRYAPVSTSDSEMGGFQRARHSSSQYPSV